jgi:SPP1 family predicted phage head-tail adaptor
MVVELTGSLLFGLNRGTSRMTPGLGPGAQWLNTFGESMNLNGKPTNPGELRVRVTLESPTIGSDSGGAQSVTYTSQGQVWAKWINAHGPESIIDGAVQGLARATVTIRYRSDITSAWAITKGSQRYQILTPPDDIQERHEYLEMQVQALKASA